MSCLFLFAILFLIILAGSFGYYIAHIERDHYSFPVYNCKNKCIGYIYKKYNKQWVPIIGWDHSVIGYMFTNKQLQESLTDVRMERALKGLDY